MAALSAVVLCALAMLPSKALAGDKDLYVTLHYQVDASARGCWDEARFRRGVAHRIGYDPFKEDAPLDLRIHVGGTALAVDGKVEWREANGVGLGERAFVAKDGNCSKLMTEMSFAVGLQIEFLRVKPPKTAAANADVPAPSPAPLPNSAPSSSDGESRVATPPAPEAPSPEVPSPTVDQTSSPPAAAPEVSKPEIPERQAPEAIPEEPAASPSEPASPWSMWAGGGPSLAWRLSPAITADGRLFLGLGQRSFSFELAAEATYPSTFHRWDGSGFRQMLIGGSLAVCGHLDWFSACALGRASQVRIKGLGVDQPRQPNGFVAQAGARLAATFHVAGPWSLATHLDGLALLTPSRVHLNQAAVWEMPRFGGVVGVDVLARFR